MQLDLGVFTRREQDVHFRVASDVCLCTLGQFDTSFAILLDCVPTDVWCAITALDIDAIIVAICDRVSPDVRLGLVMVIAIDFNAVFVAFTDFILDQVGRVVAKFDPNDVQVELITDDGRTDIYIAVDSGTSAVFNAITLDPWLGIFALDVDATRIAADDSIVQDGHLVVQPSLKHYATRLEVIKVAVFDVQVGIDRDNTGSVRRR